LNRICENGIRISAVHPSSVTRDRALHTGSYCVSRPLSSLSCGRYQSTRSPPDESEKLYAVRRSRYGSSETLKY
jgi:hypothetical protein